MPDKRYFYDSIAEEFDAVMNPYDLERRLEIVYDELLGNEPLEGRRLLDCGAGTGWFSARAADRGARVTSLDIGRALLDIVRRKCRTAPVAGDACRLPFATGAFDVVVSSECIEHTTDPRGALAELCRVTRPGGLVVVTVPNQAWHFSATVAAWFGLRPYDGYENWLRWRDVREVMGAAGIDILELRGFHAVPPLFRWTWPWLKRLDRNGRRLGPAMLNIAVAGRRR